MIFYKGEKSQIHESYLLKNKYHQLFIIRLVLTIYVHGIWWTQIYDRDNDRYTLLPFVTNLKYLTLCGCNAVNLYFVLTLVDMIRYLLVQKQFTSLWKFQHFLFQISFSAEITIFLLYWLGVYPTVSQDSKDSQWYMFTTVSYHGGLFLCVYIEFLLNNIAFKWRHFPLILLSVFVYMLDNLIVTLTTQPVYKVMDWMSVKSYIFAVVAILVTLLHFYLAKVIYEKVKLKRIQALNPSSIIQTAQINPEQQTINNQDKEQQLAEIRTQSQKQNEQISSKSYSQK